jgi:hypothetical protein
MHADIALFGEAWALEDGGTVNGTALLPHSRVQSLPLALAEHNARNFAPHTHVASG